MNWLLGNPAPIAVELPRNPAAQPGANAANSNRQQRGTVGDAPPRTVNSGTMSVYVCLLSHPRSSEMLTAEKQGKEAATEPKLYHLLHYYLLVQTNIHLPSEMFLAEGKSALHLASGWQLLCSFTITSPAALIVGNCNFPQTYVAYATVVCCYATLRCGKKETSVVDQLEPIDGITCVQVPKQAGHWFKKQSAGVSLGS